MVIEKLTFFKMVVMVIFCSDGYALFRHKGMMSFPVFDFCCHLPSAMMSFALSNMSHAPSQPITTLTPE